MDDFNISLNMIYDYDDIIIIVTTYFHLCNILMEGLKYGVQVFEKQFLFHISINTIVEMSGIRI